MKTSAVVVVVNMFKLCSSSSMFMLGLAGVLVLNINSANGVNLAPVFDQNMNQHRIKENTPVGSVIYNLSGTDPEGSTVRYGLSGKIIYLHYEPSMISQGKTPWKDPRGGFTGVSGVFPGESCLGKTPQTPVNPPRGSFPGVFP